MTWGVLIPTRGEPRLVEVDTSGFSALQELVGGYVEMVRIPRRDDGAHAYVNEDGMRLGLPVNALATVLLETPTPVLGPVVVMGGHGPDEEDVPPDLARVLVTLERWWT